MSILYYSIGYSAASTAISVTCPMVLSEGVCTSINAVAEPVGTALHVASLSTFALAGATAIAQGIQNLRQRQPAPRQPLHARREGERIVFYREPVSLCQKISRAAKKILPPAAMILGGIASLQTGCHQIKEGALSLYGQVVALPGRIASAIGF